MHFASNVFRAQLTRRFKSLGLGLAPGQVGACCFWGFGVGLGMVSAVRSHV